MTYFFTEAQPHNISAQQPSFRQSEECNSGCLTFQIINVSYLLAVLKNT